MKNIRYAYIALMVLLLASCGQGDEPVNYDTGDSKVAFIASLPGVISRAKNDINDANVLYNNGQGFLMTVFRSDNAAAGRLKPLESEVEISVTRRHDGAYRNDNLRWSDNRGANDGKMQFFAIFPSRQQLANSLGVGTDDYFLLKNYSEKMASGAVSYDYRIEKFKIANDISMQTDFVAVAAGGSKTDNLYSGVKLDFEHQLSRVDFLAWGANLEYNVEIAGIKICNVMTQGDFCFNRAPYAVEGDNATGHWEYPLSYAKDNVEYLYKPGESLFVIDENSHATKATAESILGKAGNAMLLPCRHLNWNHRDDPKNLKEGMYISVLMRLTKRSTGVQIYPEPLHTQGCDGITCWVVDESGRLVKQVYLKDNVYYADTDYMTVYDGKAGEVKEFSWAAIPLAVDWKPGYKYTYTLDYSKGVGVHDPADKSNAVGPIVNVVGFEEWEKSYKLTLTVGFEEYP